MTSHSEFAFPGVIGPPSEFASGMSLRDWFAGQALSGLLASESDDQIYPTAGCAQRAYAMADAMLAVRKVGAR